MKIQVEVGTNGKSANLQTTLTSAHGEVIIAEKKAPLNQTEVVTLDLRKLKKGHYSVTVKLSDGRSATRKWFKPYDGISRVAIDENNAILVDGKLFFPVFPWMIGSEKKLAKFKDCINTLNGVGFVNANYNIEGFKRVLDLAKANNLMMIGPNRGDYWFKGEKGTPYYKVVNKRQKDRTADIDKITKYVQAAKNHPALLFWNWKDEPELDNSANSIPPEEVRKWYETTMQLDPQHPVLLNIGGGKFQRPKDNWGYNHIKNYTYNYAFKDKKALLADVISQDYYPVDKRYHKKYPGSFEQLNLAMNEMVTLNRGLTPFGSFVETCVIARKNKSEGREPPTPKELRLMCWLNIINGARMIGWFHYFQPTPPENFKEMARFKDQITRLTVEVCAGKYEGLITQKTNGAVHFMANKTAKGIFIAAVNIKEQSDTVEFTLDFVPKNITVFDENRSIPPTEERFSDNFGPYEVRLYQITM